MHPDAYKTSKKSDYSLSAAFEALQPPSSSASSSDEFGSSMRIMQTMHLHGIAMGIAMILLPATQSQRLTPTNCRTLEESVGLVSCEADEMMFSTCGAGGEPGSCGTSAIKIECCGLGDGILTSDGCEEEYGDGGSMVACTDTDKFMQGACSSFITPACFDENNIAHTHSIKCCDYHLDGKRLYPEESEDYGSDPGHEVECPPNSAAVGRCAVLNSPDCAGSYVQLKCAFAAVCLC
ncbi:unnamed protein product [Darwinula stevensoni]|uniref:Uncharacterized protein n=1 Tax=Darwinula stevensoni TaxID=69355 RepID=A0A7R8XDP4_9CRUS|nr:unnamed protein product [Darwinula stevensoni]CAG0894993.1 unnamed protein product [Darwinula stevensoni]